MSKLDINTIPPDAAISEAIEAINNSGAQIAFVLDEDEKLIGTVTDGDVRRAILAGLTLESAVTECMHREYTFMHREHGINYAINQMKLKHIRQIPVLDDEHRVVDLYTLEELLAPPKKEMPVVIMAGGRGERLMPLTESCPKPMLHVGGRPILETILENMILQGFGRFYFCINYLGEQIKDYFGDGAKWGVTISYVEESKKLGTAGALGLLESIEADDFLVMNGDVLSGVDTAKLFDFHRDQGADLTVCLRSFEVEVPYGVAVMEETEIKSIAEKPRYVYYVSAGIYIFKSAILRQIGKDQHLDMPDLINQLSEKDHAVRGYPLHEYWADIGHHNEFKQAADDYKKYFSPR